jgi:hypothetical protein
MTGPRALQVAIMCSAGRPTIQRATLDRLVTAGELWAAPLARAPRIYFAGVPTVDVSTRQGFEVRSVRAGRPYLPAFLRVLQDATRVDAPLLFLENDVWIVRRGVPRIAELEVPADVGCVTLFDFRNEGGGAPLERLPFGRQLWGSQALLFPAAVVRRLVELGPRDLGYPNSWDCWVGRALVELRLSIALHNPSLVQHLGVTCSEVLPRDKARPWARNFPEDWPRFTEP